MLEEFSFGFPILSYLIFLPLVGAALLWLIEDEDLVKTTALGITLVELALASLVLLRFVPDSAAMQFAEHARWMPALGIGYHLAVDGISVLFVGLTAFLTVLVVIYSWDTVRNQVRLYFMALLALETTTIGIFVSIDLILFFVFWELMLIPSYFLIKLWGGGPDRHYAALKYVLYTLLGSVFMLVGIALLDINYHQWAVTHHLDEVYSFDLLQLLSVPIPLSQQILIFWLMFMGFAFKAPVFPFHTWLPDALVEGPIGMAVMLAGMKLGTYGFLRFTFPLVPDASKSEGVVAIVMVLALTAILYGAVVALVQSDFKRLLAFSSISHLGFRRGGALCPEFSRLAGQPIDHDQPGIQHRRFVFHGGILVDQAAKFSLVRLRRVCETSPAFSHLSPLDRHGLHRTTWHERIRRRIPDPPWRLQSQMVVWRGSRSRRDLWSSLFSLVLRTRDARSPDQERVGSHQRFAHCGRSPLRCRYRS